MHRRFLFLPDLTAYTILIVAALFMMVAPQGVQAQNPVMKDFSETEKIGFAFYHLSKHTPPFDDWIKADSKYQSAKPNDQMTILDEQRIRLREGFLNYFPDSDFITLRLRATVSGGPNPAYQKDPALQEAGLSHQITLTFTDLQDVPYAPVQIGRLWIGVIPDGLEGVTTHNITEDAYNALPHRMISSGKPVLAQMVLRPTKADATTPLINKNLPVWLMMADIGGVIFTDEDNALIWEYTADWYEYKRASSLMTLYSK